jgi:phage baseplate assembly protein gpV
VSIARAIASLQHEVAELRRRSLGRRRNGEVVEIDEAAGLYKVQFREGFISSWIPVEALSAGAVKIQSEPVVGQVVTVISESGDMTDAVIAQSSFTVHNQRPHGKAGELRITVGSSDLLMTPSLVRIVCGPSSIEMDASGVRIVAPEINLN